MRSQIFIRVALSFFSCGALIGAVSGHAQGTSAAPAAAPASAQKILSKNPDYLKLLNPPVGDDLLRAYSESYQKKAAEIEAKLADITDEKVRSQTREDEWAKVTKRERLQFQYEADVALNNARASFSQSHRDAWFEVGHGTYDESAAAYVVRAVPSAPMTMNFMAPMSRAALNQVYEKFHQIAAPEIEQKARAYVTESGANSNCARNPDLCFQLKSNEIEQGLRPSRVVVVAQGDLEQQKIDRLLIVDYETEGILLELDPHVPILNPVTWRFSIGKVLPPPVDPEPPAAAVQPAPAAPVVESEKGSGAGPAPNAPVLPAGPPARIAVPANVEAASIISRTKPVYPPEARAKMIHGDVVLRAIIDKEGKISELRVLDGDETLAKAAVDAVRQWRYKPMLSDGQPTEVETTVTVTFSLAE